MKPFISFINFTGKNSSTDNKNSKKTKTRTYNTITKKAAPLKDFKKVN